MTNKTTTALMSTFFTGLMGFALLWIDRHVPAPASIVISIPFLWAGATAMGYALVTALRRGQETA